MNASKNLVAQAAPAPIPDAEPPDPGSEHGRVGPIQLADMAPDGEEPASVTELSVEAAILPGEDGTAGAVLAAEATHAVRTGKDAYEEESKRASRAGRRLIRTLSAGLRPGMDPAVQQEAAALIALISDMISQEFEEYFSEISIAVAALLADPPNLVLAQQIRKQVRRRTSLALRPLLFLRSGHPAVQVILGLATMLCVAIPVSLFILPRWLAGGASGIPDQLQYTLIWVGIAGAIGSIVSILVRIRDFDDQEVEHRAILFFTGFFKPVVGIASALFVISMFEAGIITLGLPEGSRENFFYVALAFVAGFSERLAGDIVARTEKQFADPAPAKA